jgi:multiple sugar transport system substrate-binding protein
MQPKSRFARWLFSVALLGAATCGSAVLVNLTGCGDSAVSTVPPVPKYGRVRVACPAMLGETVVKSYGRSWESLHEAHLETLPWDPQKGEDPPEADVWLVQGPDLPRWAAAGKLQTLPESFATSDEYRWRSLLKLYSATLCVWDQKRYGVPVVGESLICVYRRDKLEDPQHQAAFKAKYGRDLTAPATWEQFADIAEYFARTGDKEPSLPPLPQDDAELERDFYAVAASYTTRAMAEGEKAQDDRALFSFQYDSTSGESRIATSGFVHGLKLLKRMQACRPAGAAARPAQAFADGRAVLCLATVHDLGTFQESAVKDKFKLCLLPGSDGFYDFDEPGRWVERKGNHIPYLGWGGWLGVVPKGADDDNAAFSLLMHLSSLATSRQIATDPAVSGGPTRQEHLEPASRWEAFGLDAAQTTALKDALRESLEHPALTNPAVALRIPNAAAHRAVLRQELRASLTGDRSPEEALREAAKRWSDLDQQRGLAAHRAAYQISLGLRPRD